MYLLYIPTAHTVPIFSTIHIFFKQRKNFFIFKTDKPYNNFKSLV